MDLYTFVSVVVGMIDIQLQCQVSNFPCIQLISFLLDSAMHISHHKFNLIDCFESLIYLLVVSLDCIFVSI